MRQRDYINVKDNDGQSYSFLYEFIKTDRQNKNGIHGGKISELTLFTLDDKVVGAFENGWIVLPASFTPEGKALESIIERWN